MPGTSTVDLDIAVAGSSEYVGFSSIDAPATSVIPIILDTNVGFLSWTARESLTEPSAYLSTESMARSRSWPPPWFGSIRSARTDTARRTEEILSTEFGRNGNR
jgi:hypothetical protein